MPVSDLDREVRLYSAMPVGVNHVTFRERLFDSHARYVGWDGAAA